MIEQLYFAASSSLNPHSMFRFLFDEGKKLSSPQCSIQSLRLYVREEVSVYLKRLRPQSLILDEH